MFLYLGPTISQGIQHSRGIPDNVNQRILTRWACVTYTGGGDYIDTCFEIFNTIKIN